MFSLEASSASSSAAVCFAPRWRRPQRSQVSAAVASLDARDGFEIASVVGLVEGMVLVVAVEVKMRGMSWKM